MQSEKQGLLWGIGAYIIWGFMPIYWKSLEHVGSYEILTSRIIWSFIFTLLLVLLMKNGRTLWSDWKALWKNQQAFWMLVAASVLISGNWFTYIWAVNNEHIVQTSLGYYMNPLLSVLLGVLFLNEKLSRAVKFAFVLAGIGVVILTISYGSIPWLSFILAISFAVYGLVKKQVQLDAVRGLTIETFCVLPIAVISYIWLLVNGQTSFLQIDWQTNILLILTGVATALPLIMFAKGAQQMPLYMIGFLQYIAPTIMLMLGVAVYGERFEAIDLLSFSFIWLALIVFAGSKIIETVHMKKNRRDYLKHPVKET